VSVLVRVPTILRTYTGGAGEVESSGGTLAEVLATLDGQYPGIAGRVLDEKGAVRRFVNVYVDDEDIRFAQGVDTPTPDGATISVIPAVAGG
jgi:sulfur-carrier protein